MSESTEKKSKYTEAQILRAFDEKKIDIDHNERIIKVTNKSVNVGIGTLGKIDAFCKMNPKYRFVRDVYIPDDKFSKEVKRLKISDGLTVTERFIRFISKFPVLEV